MNEKERNAMSLTYGPREKQLLKELEKISEEKKLPSNKNEILRRGLYACRYLSETNDKRLLFSLHKILKSLSERLDRTMLQFAEDLSFSILSIIVVKYGLSKADTFQNIPMNLRMFNQILDEGIDKKQVEYGIRESVNKLADSIETIFLSPSEMTMYNVESLNKMIEIIKDNFLEGLVENESNVNEKYVVKGKPGIGFSKHERKWRTVHFKVKSRSGKSYAKKQERVDKTSK